MNDTKQHLLITYLISSPDTFSLCSTILNPAYFNPGYDNVVEFIQEYYQQFSSLPEPLQIEAETGKKFELQHISPDKIEYCIKEVEAFCKHQALSKAILSCAKDINTGQTSNISKLINDALCVSVHRDLGLDYFEDPLARWERMRQSNPLVSTGWKNIDSQLGGGIKRGQLQLFAAPPGGGKSMALANLGVNFCEQGYNVLYISLELDTDLIGARLDSMFTNISQGELKSRYKEVAIKLSQQRPVYGKFKVVQMPTQSRALDIRAYMEELFLREGWRPDLLLVDYLDLMGPNEKMDVSNLFVKDKFTSEQLRDILVTYNIFGATASQLNRSAIEASELTQAHTAGGMSKVNTTDNYIAIIMSDAMRASGEMIFHFLKTRSSDGVGKRIPMRWNSSTLRISDCTNERLAMVEGVSVPLETNPTSEDLMQNTGGSALCSFLKFDD